MFGIVTFGWTSVSYDWWMIFKATINQSYVMLFHPNYPRIRCAESLYPFPLWFPEWGVEVNWLLDWGSSRHFAPPPLVSPRNHVWETRAEIAYWWRVTTKIWIVFLIGCRLFSLSNSSSDGLRENKETERETPSLALGICEFYPKSFLDQLNAWN